MYEALVARIRYHILKANFIGLKEAESTLMLAEAADAIEELTADLERSKEWEGFWEEEANKAVRNLQQYARAVANKPRWIPVEERLPEEHVFVLIRQEDDRMMVAARIDGNWWYRYFAYDVDRWDENEQGTITHWMPLPEPPTAEEGE